MWILFADVQNLINVSEYGVELFASNGFVDGWV